MKNKIRSVQAFSVSSYQKNTKVCPPPKLNLFEENNVSSSTFRRLFLRGDIPCHRSFKKERKKLKQRQKENETMTYLMWKIPPQNLDCSHYLPIFFDGLCEATFPYNFIARNGIYDILKFAAGDKILPVIPHLIIPIKNALHTKNWNIIIATLHIIQYMCKCKPCVGVFLVPYFRQILPIFNLFRDCNINTYDGIDYDRAGRVGDVIEDTLEVLERFAGPHAFINIKYCVPTYESCVNN